MGLTPATQYQVPEHAILDINGKQTYLGNSFVLPVDGQELADTDEHPIALISNPANSKKALFLFSRKTASDNTSSSVVVRFYGNPTVTMPGAPTAPVNLRPANANTSISNCYLAPTVSANGTLQTALVGLLAIEVVSNVLTILDPGQNLLVTAQAISNPATVYVEHVWYEI